ncbi:retropepsin-like aspartic protease [Mucilaginibacter sp. dw_454]|uniref:retropepsin-like aspartic protease n=1 Tax=Mucilaginibacter sp. dw_454 TaxID=2720079 RepID=UPI001BD38012|nr:retropepsin-like aspartic protease [Mucilaginibacter sp. dw_454]
MKLITLLLFLLPVSAISQNFSYNQGGTSQKNYYQEIPYLNINGKIFVDVEIAGGKHRFLLDTGAPTAISNELAAQIGAKVINQSTIHDTFHRTNPVTTVQANGIKLGDITFDQIPAITVMSDLYTCFGADGVIGSNLLRNSIVSIDSKRHMIILTDQKKKLALKSKNSVDMITNVGVQSDPQIKIVLKNKLTLTIPFDSGDNAFLRIDDKTVRDLRQYTLFDTLAKGYGASAMSMFGMQQADIKHLYKVVFFTVGNGRFDNLIIESNKEVIPAIGSKLLAYGVATLDFIHSKFYFDAYQIETDLSEKQWPLRPTFVGKLIIGVVWDKASDIVKQGEQIIAIDDRDYSNATLCELLNDTPPLYGKEQATLTLKNAQGEIRKVTIKKE